MVIVVGHEHGDTSSYPGRDSQKKNIIVLDYLMKQECSPIKEKTFFYVLSTISLFATKPKWPLKSSDFAISTIA